MSFFIEALISGTTVEIINKFLQLKKNTEKEEIESDEWKELEKAYFKHLKWRFIDKGGMGIGFTRYCYQ